MKNTFIIHTIFPNYYDETWVSYTVKSLLNEMKSPSFDHRLYVLSKKKNIKFKNITSLLPNFLLRYTSKLFEGKDQTKACQYIVNKNISTMQPGDVAYFWLANPVEQCIALKNKGVLIAREMINCSLAMKRDELSKAYALLGLNTYDEVTDEAIEEEKKQLLCADMIFCSSNLVLKSVLDYGVPAEKCIKIGYGWEKGRFNAHPNIKKDDGEFNALFVGTIDVRKGIPVLFDAWQKANIKGTLTLAGRIDIDIKNRYSAFLKRPDVIQLGHVKELEHIYRAADVFCFLSWEEGCPLVTLEATGCGLPCIVTPMGSAGAITDLNGGLMVKPGDINGTVQALQRLANDKALLTKLGKQAQLISEAFTWKNAAISRVNAIQSLRSEKLS